MTDGWRLPVPVPALSLACLTFTQRALRWGASLSAVRSFLLSLAVFPCIPPAYSRMSMRVRLPFGRSECGRRSAYGRCDSSSGSASVCVRRPSRSFSCAAEEMERPPSMQPGKPGQG